MSERRVFSARIPTTLYDAIAAYCQEHQLSQADLMIKVMGEFLSIDSERPYASHADIRQLKTELADLRGKLPA